MTRGHIHLFYEVPVGGQFYAIKRIGPLTKISEEEAIFGGRNLTNEGAIFESHRFEGQRVALYFEEDAIVEPIEVQPTVRKE